MQTYKTCWNVLIMYIIQVPVILFILAADVFSRPDESCCLGGATQACRSTCREMLQRPNPGTMIRYYTVELIKDCSNFHSFSNENKEMWSCLSKDGGPNFWNTTHFRCCHLSENQHCKDTCETAQANEKAIVRQACKKEEKQRICTVGGDKCCGMGQTRECRAYCEAIFALDTPPLFYELEVLKNTCNSEELYDCVADFLELMTERDTIAWNCCGDLSSQCKPICGQASNTVLLKDYMNLIAGSCTFEDITSISACIERITGGKSQEESTELAGFDVRDGAKAQCCVRALSARCRDLCLQIHTARMTTPAIIQLETDFQSTCLFLSKEWSLTRCITEVDAPCQLGCSGLNFCTNFNNRPTDLFHSCSSTKDDRAWQEYQILSRGALRFPGDNFIVPIKSVHSCLPEMWRAVLCALEIQPCHRDTHTSFLCQSDCIMLLSQCVEWSRINSTARELCSKLTPFNDPTKCLSVQPLTVPSKHIYSTRELSHPCAPDSCPYKQTCVINRDDCASPFDTNCAYKQCVLGCPIGMSSSLVVPPGSLITVEASYPDISSQLTSRVLDSSTRYNVEAGREQCVKTCRCSNKGEFRNCISKSCTRVPRSCDVPGKVNTKFKHGHGFFTDCNYCVCDDTELTCTRRYCLAGLFATPVAYYTGLPCNSVADWEPVCGNNGKTYPNAMIAQCLGLSTTQYWHKSCFEVNPCVLRPCGDGKVCVPMKRVCLTTDSCPQYLCYLREDVWAEECGSDKVCDTKGVTYDNICQLINAKKTLAYEGACERLCDAYQTRAPALVCGMDGNTYTNLCAAYKQRVLVDYQGPCKAVGILTENDNGNPWCQNVLCDPKRSAGCTGVTPPGACCPVCGGVLRTVYSNRTAAQYSQTAQEPLTTRMITETLRTFIAVPQCDLYGHLSVEHDLTFVVLPTSPSPTSLQIMACVEEAVRLGTLINNASPLLFSHWRLSPLLGCQILSPPGISAGVPSSTPQIPLLITLCSSVLFLVTLATGGKLSEVTLTLGQSSL